MKYESGSLSLSTKDKANKAAASNSMQLKLFLVWLSLIEFSAVITWKHENENVKCNLVWIKPKHKRTIKPLTNQKNHENNKRAQLSPASRHFSYHFLFNVLLLQNGLQMFVSSKWVNILFLDGNPVCVTQVLAVRCAAPRGCWENREPALTSRRVTCFSLRQRPEHRQNPAATNCVSPKNSQESCPMNPRPVFVPAEELGSDSRLSHEHAPRSASKPVWW